MKRLIVCCDGTWQKLSSPYPTNVVKIAQAIKPSCMDGIPQIVFYDEGVGSGNMAEKLFAEGDKIIGGAFGIGIDNNIQNAYRFLSLNYEPDNEIYLFGFSRGSYAVRSLAGLIRCSGGLLSLKNIREAPLAYELYRDRALTLKEKEQFRKLPLPYIYREDAETIKKCRSEVHQIYSNRHSLSFEKAGKDTAEAQTDLADKTVKVQTLLSQYGLSERQDSEIRQAVKITLLGCWDTVGSLGVPATVPFLSDWINQKYEFHDSKLSSIIQNALHAVAIDEHREVFDVTPMERKQNDIQPLRQIWFPGGHGCIGGGSKAERLLSDSALDWMLDQISNPNGGLGLGLEFDRSVVEDSIASDHKGKFNSSIDLFYSVLGIIDRKIPRGQFEILHESVKKRWRDCEEYRPKHLNDSYGTELDEWSRVHCL